MPNDFPSLLDTHGISSPKWSTAQSARAYRYYLSSIEIAGIAAKKSISDLFDYQRSAAPNKGMRLCQTQSIEAIRKATEEYIVERPAGLPYASLHINARGYMWSGLASCNSGYCVHCARVRSSQRQARIEQGIKALYREGYTSYFVTLTMPRSSSIANQLQSTRLGWRNIQRALDRKYKTKECKNYHTVRALDVTFAKSKDTYHLHVHSIIAIRTLDTEEDVNDLISKAWTGSVDGSERWCQKVEQVHSADKLATYCSKMAGLALEITAGYAKSARAHASYSLPEIMSLAISGDKWAHGTYRDFLRAISGKKTLTFSRGWPDEEEEDKEPKEEERVIIDCPLMWWDVVRKHTAEIGAICHVSFLQGGKTHKAIKHLQWLFEQDTYEKAQAEIGDMAETSMRPFLEREIKFFLEDFKNDYEKNPYEILS